jgi:hypothetical protein
MADLIQEYTQSLLPILEANKSRNFDIEDSGTRDLDSEKVRQYLSQFDPGLPKRFADTVLSSTQYVDFQTLKKNLLLSLDRFLAAIQKEPYLILFPNTRPKTPAGATKTPPGGTTKFGSEQWLTHLIYPYLKDSNLVGLLSDEEEFLLQLKHLPTRHILIIDDCLYSGINTMGKIDEITYHTKSQLQPDHWDPKIAEINKKRFEFHFHLVIPYASFDGKETIREFCRKAGCQVSLYNVVSLNNTLVREMKTLSSADQDQIQKLFDIELMGYPIYFDHKVANNFGSFPSIYLEGRILKNGVIHRMGPLLQRLPTRHRILEVESLHQEK